MIFDPTKRITINGVEFSEAQLFIMDYIMNGRGMSHRKWGRWWDKKGKEAYLELIRLGADNENK